MIRIGRLSNHFRFNHTDHVIQIDTSGVDSAKLLFICRGHVEPDGAADPYLQIDLDWWALCNLRDEIGEIMKRMSDGRN